MSTEKTEKPPRIKGIVKRCRSFKEDILSRLARNKSLGKDEGSSSGSKRSSGLSHNCSSEGGSPTPRDKSTPGSSVTPDPPQVSLAHGLKEAYLTLKFVESVIRKNSIELLGGSSNVMLDLMGGLLDNVKKTSVSDSSPYQSAISQVKSVLSDFLTAVDMLLLRDRCDDAQRELYYEKILDTVQSTREALTRLKNLVDSKDFGLGNASSASLMLLPSNPPGTVQLRSPSSTSRLDSISDINLSPGRRESGIKKPPLPPKLKQWVTKSFDMESSSPTALPPSNHRQHYCFDSPDQSKSSANPPTSLLSQWLEQSHLNNDWSRSSSRSASSNSHQLHHYHYGSQPQCLNTRASGSQQGSSCQQHVTSASSTSAEAWTDSAVYVGRSSSTCATSSSSKARNTGLCEQIGSQHLLDTGAETRKARTVSDSYYALHGNTSQESLDRILFPDEEAGAEVGSHTTTASRSLCSQSLSLGSSLDNLLLVDSHSQNSGLSPNSANRISVSSCNNRTSSSRSPSGGLAGLCNYDPDTDGEVFMTGIQSQSDGAGSLSSAIREDDDVPPELPKKTRQFLIGKNGGATLFGDQRQASARCPSPYDNIDESVHSPDPSTWHGEGQDVRSFNQSFQQQRQFMSYSESRTTLVGISGTGNGTDAEDRPPLPPKKKHSITAYVEFFHNFDASSHHQHFQNHQFNHAYRMASLNQQPCGSSVARNHQASGFPGHLAHPPLHKSYSHSASYQHFSSFSSTATSIFTPTSEEEFGQDPNDLSHHQYHPMPPAPSFDSMQSNSSQNNSNSSLARAAASNKPPALPPKKSKMKNSVSQVEELGESVSYTQGMNKISVGSPTKVLISPAHSLPTGVAASASTPVHLTSALGESLESPQLSLDEDNMDLYILDASPMLVSHTVPPASASGKPSAEGPEVKGADPLFLMVYACSPDLQDVKFREVFLLTYRTFLRPLEVVNLLWKRYQYFEKATDRVSVIHRRATLDLFVDVINYLTPMDMEDDIVLKVRTCIYHLVNCGEMLSALKARKALIEKYGTRLKLLSPKPAPAALAVSTEHQSLLCWGATSIAQQMTLLDSDLFRHLEPAELLLWAREQQEDFCLALNNFTDHFNKVSYWARSKVLLCSTSRERNRTMKRLIEVMRKLREYNNFNSLLAVLAALDSAPIRRLGFSRRLTEALKPHAALTDSSGSFRTYRQALSDSKPPCIPYIGLVLQDLTFVHIGNADFLSDGKVNWLKRWQQWLVLEPIRRFHACQYNFTRNDGLLTYLNNFDESLNDDDLWQLSEAIKPRGKN